MKHTFYPYIILLTLVSTFSACRVGRNYQQPEAPLPAAFTGNATTDSSIATISWKQFFQDPLLQQLIDSTISNNLDLKIALQRIEASEAYVKQARAAFLPSVNAQITGSTSFPSKHSLNGLSLENFLKTNHIEDYNLSLGASWEADIWGKIRRQKEAAIAQYLQTYEGARAVQTALVADVANGYINLLMLDAQLRIANRNVALSDTIVQMMNLQKTSGEVTELAVQQAVSQKQSAAKLVPQLEQAIAIQQNAIKLLGAQLPGEVVRIGDINEFTPWEALHTGVPAALLQYRPDVKAAEQRLVAANAQVGVAQANLYPSLSITANGGLNAFKASQWFTLPGSLFATAAGSITQPIFQRRQLKTQVEVATTQREEAVFAFRQSVLTAVHEVSNNLVSIDKLKSQEQIAIDQQQVTHAAVNNAQLLFKSGMANYLEVITAQSNALQAELSLADIHRQQLQAVANLYRSLGGGTQ
ncbi:NodT family efflux transporter outer membrane factor (OMF) lipoprotein [Chitinophaga skermanii]|uniref:NodT family efflux transporter outer membrane factor (OMF) lipoprotein n=1 Tax=Chitinophaga skermanii TaxID=331697 RepID=A0A327Q8X2_9BACT|nr:efflux transporter outer membrane subunit [Chitinophaga skermanii]RAJ00385.1 NodT family efflux transporter outer membrane factor (OMF) lipoprotein [Chitinophaga skermanii]